MTASETHPSGEGSVLSGRGFRLSTRGFRPSGHGSTRSRRGFTLIELLIVLAVMGVVLIPTAELFLTLHRESIQLSRLAGLKAEQSALAHQVFAELARRGGGRVSEDNHGLIFPDGARLGWADGRVTLREKGRERSLSHSRVVEFTVVRQPSGRLTLNLALEARPLARHGAPIRYPAIFDGPEPGVGS